MKAIYLSVIVPVYNEALTIGETIRKLREFLEAQSYSWELIICDDGSTDGTSKMFHEEVKNVEHIRALSLPHRGKGATVRDGVLDSTGKFIFMCDADLSMSVDQIPIFLQRMDNSDIDIVIGSRQVKGSVRVGEPPLRHFMGRIFNKLVKIILVDNYHDSQCGFKCFSSKSARHLFPKQRVKGWAFDAEILFLAGKIGYKTKEIPIEWYHRSDSKVGVISSSLSMLTEILMVRIMHTLGRYGL